MNTTATLTRRQYQMAELFAWGATKKDVANNLKVSIRTVENTMRNIFERCEVTKVNELSAWFFCTKFNISFDFSPLKRAAVSVLLLFILLPFDFNGGDVQRVFRSGRSTTCRVVRRNEIEA